MFSKDRAEPALAEIAFSAAGRTAPLIVVRSAQARRASLRLDRRGDSVRLTLPKRAALRDALAWAESQRGFIEAQLARLPAPCGIEPDAMIPLFGDPVRLDWAADRPRKIVRDGDRLVAGGPREGLEARVLRWLKSEAKADLTHLARHYALAAGVSVAAVGVGDPVSRWGSCSASGSIRFSWRLVLAPEFVRQAIAAHEVAHRVHMNHSRAFHDLVEHLLGVDPKPAYRWLRSHGASLQRFGGTGLGHGPNA